MVKETILIVDDERFILRNLELLLTGRGYDVLLAASGREALERLAERPVSLIISDYKMPGMNGIDLLEEVHRLFPETIRVLITGCVNNETAIAAINKGHVYRYINKPWETEEFLLIVAACLAHHALLAEKKRLLLLTLEQQRVLEEVNAKLAAERRRMQTILQNMAEGIVVTDECGRITFVNRAFAAMAGQPADALLAVDFIQFQQAGRPEEQRAAVAGTWYLAGPGGRLPVASSTTVFQEDEDGAPGYVHTIRDISSEKKLDQLKADFFAMVIHDLRSPLLALIYRLLALRRQLVGRITDAELGRLEESRQTAQMLLGLIDNLLDISKVESGKLALRMEPLDLHGIIELALNSLEGLRVQHDLRVERHFAAGLPLVAGDKDGLTRVMINLVGNAIKFTKPGGLISIRTAPEEAAWGKMVVVAVSDTGDGIPPEDLELIFDLYYQGKSGGRREERGKGLGLAICKKIIEAHGGAIGVESVIGQGATFRVTLPAAAVPPVGGV